ncbi:hypothetical protein N7539_002919 [Penicillium diatomitis]|uniref:Anaphase-promoting complex subunit 4 n=1 Tax=Penicillium diatomitis TaxID=2819901 RepID=A0A9X0BZN0_9EURO|nr:uncharacterized protein N7539_002919 [Penicillium diatomitis]KAJ5491352.1 hypothetical protein N7539_002919 [Penicillium diatomitis]
MADLGPQLAPVGEKTLLRKCNPSTLAYCPSMDLIALATDDDKIEVYRLNGQRVFGGSFKGDPYLGEDEADGEVRAVAWKGNGRLLAVACGDGSIRIISAYSGKTVHHYRAHEEKNDQSQSCKVTCLGWGINFTDSKAAQKHLQGAAGQISVEDLLAPGLHPSKAGALLKADLPRELMLMDIESSLPKLSVLPATGAEDDLFSSRASIDAIFHASAKDNSDSVDVLFVGLDDGSVHLRIFDCFEIGSFPIFEPEEVAEAGSVLRHASHPLSSTHALLVSHGGNKGQPKTPLRLVTLDLRFITKSGRYLSLLASKTTQLQNLLRYIGQVQKQIELEWKTAQELPARFLRNANQDLQERCQCDFTTAIYHLVVTGHCFEPLKEFLVDIVGERGHKRWDKAVSGGYENIRRLTHECLLPALERSQVLLSRLVGLSKFSKLNDVLGLDSSKLTAIVETVDCLYLLSHHIINHANEELDQFTAFSRSLHHEILILSSEPLSQTWDELLEKRELVDVPPTVKYITGPLRQSALRHFIRQLPMLGIPHVPTPQTDKWLPHGHDRSFFDDFKVLLSQQKQVQAKNGDTTMVDAPKLNDLTRRLGVQFEKVFAEIALTQRRGILHHTPITLHEDCDSSVLDMKLCYEDQEKGQPCSIYVAAKSVSDASLIYIYRVVLDSINGVSSTRNSSIAALFFDSGSVRQVQFVEDDTLMILFTSDTTSHLLNLGFQPHSTAEAFALNYTDNDPQPTVAKPKVTRTKLDIPTLLAETNVVVHTFASAGPNSSPVRIDVNGRAGRRAVCVLYGDGMRYDVLDLDAAIGEEGGV